MSRLLVRPAAPSATDAAVLSVTPESAGWRYVGLSSHRLTAGEAVERETADRELAVIVLSGSCRVRAGGDDLGSIGGRSSPFDSVPAGLALVAPGRIVRIGAASDADVVLASAPAGAIESTRAVAQDAIRIEERGAGSTARRVHHLLPPGAVAGRLIITEVVTPAGNWSSWPPHKHDTDAPPREALLEETYLYRFERPGAFAVQRVYSSDGTLDEAVAVRDGDLVLVPRGYHTVAAAPGYRCYYLNVMAGPKRRWSFTVDPDHEWLMDWDPSVGQA